MKTLRSVWLGFKDPSFPLPQVIENLFPHRASLVGIPRGRLATPDHPAGSRKFGRQFNSWALYKYVSGVNAVRLRSLMARSKVRTTRPAPSGFTASFARPRSPGRSSSPRPIWIVISADMIASRIACEPRSSIFSSGKTTPLTLPRSPGSRT